MGKYIPFLYFCISRHLKPDFPNGQIIIAWPNLLCFCKEQSIIFSLNENVQGAVSGEKVNKFYLDRVQNYALNTYVGIVWLLFMHSNRSALGSNERTKRHHNSTICTWNPLNNCLPRNNEGFIQIFWIGMLSQSGCL